MKKFIFSIAFLAILILPGISRAEERVVHKAEVLTVVQGEAEAIFDNVPVFAQELTVRFIGGERAGETVEFTNDYIRVREGDIVYVTESGAEDSLSYTIFEMNRMRVILPFALAFLALTILFGGIQGVRALASLGGSLALIVYVLLPGIIGGVSPIVVGVAVSSAIIIFGSYVTHGFNRTTSSAVISMIITVVLTGVLASVAVGATRLNGMADEETLYLSINLGRSIDLIGLLMSGFIIGLLGVLYDTAISQAISVEELLRFAPKADKSLVYKRALRMGREHIGALINTLAIAYVGASLPLFLLFYSDTSVAHSIAINNEIFVAEILRTIIGGIGVILAVPITTFLAVQMLYGREFKDEFHGHSHSHGHQH